MNSNPPAVLRPRIGGKPKPNTIASCSCANFALRLRRIVCELQVACVLRSSQGFSSAITVATFELIVSVVIEAAERRDRFHARNRAQIVLDLRDARVGALERRAVRQADGDEEDALIFVRQESRRQRLEQRAGGKANSRRSATSANAIDGSASRRPPNTDWWSTRTRD